MSERLLVFAPDGIGEVTPGADLAELVLTACAGDRDGPLRDGDVVVVTSKVVSKAEGRAVPGTDREASITTQTVRTVARRGPTRIVENPQGLVQAAAGVDASNVAPGTVLLLPVDPDASADRLRTALQERTGRRLGVVVSDTSGRAWRHGQIDLAIGAAGVRTSLDHAGRRDTYGNELVVTQMAVADEIASAADLVKAKLDRRPVAVLRGLDELLTDAPAPARALSRTGPGDMFARGTREAVLHAALVALGRGGEYEALVRLDGEELLEAVCAGTGPEQAELLGRLLRAAAHQPLPEQETPEQETPEQQTPGQA